MIMSHGRALLLALSSASFCAALVSRAALWPALAQTSSLSADAPEPNKKPSAPKAQKPKTSAAHPKKQDISESDKKPASTTIPMDFSSMKKPSDQDTSSSSKSDFDGPLKPDLGGSNGMSPGMKFNW